MGLKNQLTKTPYLVLFIVLISVGVATASALATYTFTGNVMITDDLEVDGKSTFHSSIIQERPSGNSDNFVIQRDGGAASDKPKFVLSQRSNNVQLWLYGNDGSTFKNFIGFDFPNYNVRIPANGDTLVVDAENDKVGIGTLTPSSELEVVGNVTISGNLSASEAIECPNCILGFYKTGHVFEGNPGTSVTLTAFCDSGDIITGGGNIGHSGVMTQNYLPTADSWKTVWANTTSELQAFELFIICADYPPAH